MQADGKATTRIYGSPVIAIPFGEAKPQHINVETHSIVHVGHEHGRAA